MKINKKNTFVVPPIIREEVKNLNPKEKDFVLVYLSKENKRVIKILKNLDENFIVYGYNKNRNAGNLRFRVKKYFLDDLEKCRAVIATAGFSLVSESIYLKKPYFALPLEGQFEQMINALSLQDSGFGCYSKSPTKEEIETFLFNLSKYKKNLSRVKIDSKKVYQTLDYVLEKIKEDKIKK